MKRILILLLVLLFSAAQADGLVIEPYEGGVAYSFAADSEFLIVQCKTNMETVRQTVFSESGVFSGDITLPHTFDASYVKVIVETLKGNEVLSASAQTAAVARTVPVMDLADAEKTRKLADVEIIPMIHALGYRFRAPGRDTLLLKYRSSTERGSVLLYAGGEYIYDGVLELPYTYHYSNVVLTVADSKNINDLYEIMLRTAYPPAPEAPQRGEGRLNGITVCIDPGHQANGEYIREEIGPGLEGTKVTCPGMARGIETKRMESIVVLEISLMLRDALLAEGAEVVMTRSTQDTFVSNIRRAEIANEADADIFLRLHGNARDNHAAQGICIYCPSASDYARAIAGQDGWRAMGDILLRAMQAATGQSKGGTALTNEYIGNNWAAMPSFLIEMGYMSNSEEDVLLSADPYRRRLVEGMVNGVYELAAFLGLAGD